MTLIDWKSIFTSYGILGVIIVGLIYIIFTKVEWFKEVLGLFKKSTVAISDTQLSNHVVFSQFDFWMVQKIPTLNFKTKFRNLVFRDYLAIYLKVYKIHIENFVKSKKYETLDNNEFWNSISELINTITKEYELEMSTIGIPILVIEKMKIRNNDYVELMRGLIKGISESEFYKSDKNRLKMYSVLNIICPIIESSIFHSEVVCTVLNGELTGKTYKNETEIKMQV